MKNAAKRISIVTVLAIILMFGGVVVFADSVLPGTPLAPEDWSMDTGDYDLALYPREHVMRFAIGQYAFSKNGAVQVSDAAPFIAEGKTMIPLRLIAETMGAYVEWDGRTRTVSISLGVTVATLVIDQTLPDGMGTPTIRNDRTFVPLRFVAEALGAVVEWDSTTQSIEVIWTWETLIGSVSPLTDGEEIADQTYSSERERIETPRTLNNH